MSAYVCAGCMNTIKRKECLQCFFCHLRYDLLCANVPEKQYKLMSIEKRNNWKCPACRSKQPKNDISNTPVGSNRFESPTNSTSASQESYSPSNVNITARPTKRQALSSPMADYVPITREEVRQIMDEVLERHLSDLMNELSVKMRTMLDLEFKTIKEEMKDFRNAMEFMNDQFENVLKEHKATEEHVRMLRDQNKQVEATMTDLQARINLLEQNARSKNIEIQCLPEKKTENLKTIVKDISKVIECEMKDEDILHVTRIAKANPESSRPRSVVVELRSTLLRDHFLAATINFNKKNPSNKLNSSHISCSGPKVPIYITEHLSSYNRSLHAAARLAAKEKNYKFVWIRGGRVFMRKTEGDRYILVKDRNTLTNLK